MSSPDQEPTTNEEGETPTEAIRRNFAAVAAATDTPPPGEGSRLPSVNVAQPISSLARTVGMVLHGAPLFRLGEGLATVDEKGRVAVMTPKRFTSWVESHLAFSGGKSITPDLAAQILAADQCVDQLRELKAVSLVRLPTWQGQGEERTVELARPGYDATTGCFTVDGVPYPDDLEVKEGFGFLLRTLQEFPFDPEGEPNVAKRRSFAAQFAAMLGIYCHALFPEGTARPFVVYNANQPGSGKSLLMRIAVSPVHGPPPEAGKSETEAEFEKTLDAAALARSPFLLLDDCKSIHSQALNRFVTSPVHQCRLMHSQRNAQVPKVTQVFATGNGLTVSGDLDRRSLVIDLFEPGEARSRSFEHEITTGWLFAPETRALFLAAMWSLVRTWRDEGMPTLTEHRRGSFETWSGTIGGIVTACRMSNPFAPRKAATGGDESTRSLVHVLSLIVGESKDEEPPVLSTSDILGRAEDEEQIELIVGFAKDPKKSLGWKLKKLRGRHLSDAKGRLYEFGRRDLSQGSKYAVRFL